MATDYDAPRKTEDEPSEESIEELKTRRHDKNSGKVDEDEAEAAESFELPGADLSHEELAVRGPAAPGRRVHLHELLPGSPPQSARGREEADLPRLRLNRVRTPPAGSRDSARGPRWVAACLSSGPVAQASTSWVRPATVPGRRRCVRRLATGEHPGDADRGAADDRPEDRLAASVVGVGGVGRRLLAARAELPPRSIDFLTTAVTPRVATIATAFWDLPAMPFLLVSGGAVRPACPMGSRRDNGDLLPWRPAMAAPTAAASAAGCRVDDQPVRRGVGGVDHVGPARARRCRGAAAGRRARRRPPRPTRRVLVAVEGVGRRRGSDRDVRPPGARAVPLGHLDPAAP